ncbi:MAG TPA: hypothetical protein VMV34_10310 [Terriglobia bacterium]|nr:hypothetical protein [Terriglobia bacterium]
MVRRIKLMIALLAGIGIGANPIWGQQLGKEALSSFPAGIIQIEYSSPAKLRTLPDYGTLRERYMGPWLKELETSLKQLGVKESDVNELVLGWASSGDKKELYGLASGSFDPKVLGERAAERQIAPETIGTKTGYCLGAGLETPCVVVLGANEGAFGTLSALSEMMDVRGGARPSLGSDAQFAKVVAEAKTEAPIWGVSTDGAIAVWFKGWMPSQGDIQLDWSQVFQGVDTLSYSINAGSDVHLHLELYCKSSESATSLRQVLEGLKLAQQLAWQTQHPNQANPFSGMSVELNGGQISVNLTASYDELSAAGPMGAPPSQ